MSISRLLRVPFFCLTVLALCCGPLGLSQAGSGALLSASESSATARTTFQARVEKHAEALLATGERWPGSPGATAADAYIAEQLAAAGMQEQHSFSTPVLMQLPQGEPRLQLSGDDSEQIAVLPHVAMGGSPAGTGALGITAPLARLSTDLTSEQSLAGAIVVVPASAPQLWLKAAEFGAQAIVFEMGQNLDRLTLQSQMTSASLPLVRVVTTTPVPDQWLGQSVTLTCHTPNQQVNALNRVVYLPPTNKTDSAAAENDSTSAPIIHLAATYEGAGWIVGLDPATTSAWNAATLLALSEHLVTVDRRNGVVVQFYGGQREKARGHREMQGILANLHPSGQTTDPMTSRSGGIVDINLDRTNYNLQVTEDVIAAYEHFLAAVAEGTEPSPELLQASLEATADTAGIGGDASEDLSTGGMSSTQIILLVLLVIALLGTVAQIARKRWSMGGGILFGLVLLASIARILTVAAGFGAGIGLTTSSSMATAVISELAGAHADARQESMEVLRSLDSLNRLAVKREEHLLKINHQKQRLEQLIGIVPADIGAAADATAAEVKKWRDLQQKIGKTELTPEEAHLLPELARSAIAPEGALGRQRRQLLEQRGRFEQAAQVSAAIGPTKPLLNVIFNCTDGSNTSSVQFDTSSKQFGSFLTKDGDKISKWLPHLLRDVTALTNREADQTLVAHFKPMEPYQGNSTPKARFPVHALASGNGDGAGMYGTPAPIVTLDDDRLKLGSPADTPEAFQRYHFLDQVSGFDALFETLVNYAPLAAIPKRQPFHFKPALVRTETRSIGSPTGRKGYPFPTVHVYNAPAKGTDAPIAFGDVGPYETYIGNGLGEIIVPYFFDQAPGYQKKKKSKSVFQLRPYGYDANGQLVSILASKASGKGAKSGKAEINPMQLMQPSLLMFEPTAGAIYGGYDFSRLRDLKEIDLLSASSDSKPSFAHFETRNDHIAIFSTAATRVRVMLRENALNKRQMILGDEIEPGTFRGPMLGQESLTKTTAHEVDFTAPTSLAAAQDALALNRSRLEKLQKNGISPSTPWALLATSQRHLTNGMEALLAGDFAAARVAGMRANATAMRAYPDVITLANDVVYALVVMLLFAIPFAYLCERLFISANTIQSRVAGFGGFFVATFAFLYFFHPAFALATTPAIILLAFCILVMSAQVIIILGNRFEYEMEQIRLTSLGIRKVDVNRLSTLLATGTLGISNMRRRPLRTFLTGSTVVLMTFIMLTFADFSKRGGTIDRAVAAEFPNRQGVQINQPGFVPLRNEAAGNTRQTLAGLDPANLTSHARYWVNNKADFASFALRTSQSATFVEGVMGLEAKDPSGTDQALWRGPLNTSAPGLEPGWIYAAPEVQEALGVAPGETVQFRGHALKLGLIDTERFDSCTTLDGEALTPYAASSTSAEDANRIAAAVAEGAEVDTSTFIHLASDQVAVVSAEIVKSMGGNISSIEISGRTPGASFDWTKLGRELATELNMAVAVSHQGVVRSWRFVPDLGGKGIGAIIIPLILGGMIIFSTMLGSVAERGKEIFIYSSLGLAPLHVGALFLVEAGIYALIGGMGGYLTAQAVGTGLNSLADFGLITRPDLNYSSFSAVMVMIIIMIVVLISALYPAWVAAKAANPSAEETFVIPEPDSQDCIAFPFPFTVSRRDIGGLGAYLHSYFEANQSAAVGCFTCDEVTYEQKTDQIAVGAKTWLAPFDLGISQRFHMRALPTDMPAIFGIEVSMTLMSGQKSAWQRMVPRFVKDLRGQFLVWRSLDEETRDRFRAEAGDVEAQKRHAKRQAENTEARDQSMTKVATNADKQSAASDQSQAAEKNDKVGEA